MAAKRKPAHERLEQTKFGATSTELEKGHELATDRGTNLSALMRTLLRRELRKAGRL